MRIISGKWRTRRIVAPQGNATRPSTDRVREALFSMLTSRLGSFDGLRVADLFAGSGALGLEALSRGAARCLFAEQDARALRVLRQNISALGAGDQCRIHAGAVLSLPRVTDPFDLIMMDPPYDTITISTVLDHLVKIGMCAQSTWVSIETSLQDNIRLDEYHHEISRNIGGSSLHILQRA